MWQLITSHEFWSAIALYWVASAAIDAMPEPQTTSGAGYLWLYRFLHTVAGNVKTALLSKIPNIAGVINADKP